MSDTEEINTDLWDNYILVHTHPAGLSKRGHVASLMMASIGKDAHWHEEVGGPDEAAIIAKRSVQLADALLKELDE